MRLLVDRGDSAPEHRHEQREEHPTASQEICMTRMGFGHRFKCGRILTSRTPARRTRRREVGRQELRNEVQSFRSMERINLQALASLLPGLQVSMTLAMRLRFSIQRLVLIAGEETNAREVRRLQ